MFCICWLSLIVGFICQITYHMHVA
jgi:hypothetical protein